jgi:hypothetical protein
MTAVPHLPPPWEPHIGDPTVIGWVITAMYAVAVVTAALAARADRGPARNLWIALAVGLSLLGINKQLDLQTPFFAFGHRALEAAPELAALRRVLRVVLLVAVIGGAALVTFAAARTLRRAGSRRYRLALLGIAGLTLFVVMRASAFDHVGNVVGQRVLYSKKLAAGLELGSLVLIVANALHTIVVARRGGDRG